ncbi:MAG: DegV family EDD domain-containing protein [Lachnospiraceae bacterium]|nr:DegV family EDD domain-containing protein [Lachnospiraceae bacterium]
MNPNGIIKRVYSAIKDPDRPFTERLFLILAIVSEVTVTIALIGDLFIHENPREIILLIAVLIMIPAIILPCLYLNRLRVAINIIVVTLVFGILPMLFFFGGGLDGGGVIWMIFGFVYVGLVLHGKWRNVMFLLITVVAMGCFIISWYFPQTVYVHTQSMRYIDFFISLVMVGVVCFITNWFQGRLFKEENERVKKEAERAEELTRSQNRFFSSMSHEIRTPINSILGLNELILRDQETSEEVVKDSMGIQGSGKMLLALINDILDFSKIEAGSMDIVPVDYRIGDMLSEIVGMMWLKAQEKGLRFEVSVDPEVPQVLYGDEVRIKQVIINLLNNAVKYTKEGWVELRLESREADEDTVELWISIADSGMGIKKEDIPYLFDAFKRVDEGKNRHIEGTGLGLSIVKQLVELMDGHVSVNSVYGEGTTFTVRIKQKITDRNSVGELNIHNQQIVRRSTHESSFLAPEARILIVDDNEMNLEVESRLLEDTDMAIDKALSGRQALEMCLNYHYDAIFMDHLMPEMDGIKCLEIIREQAGGLNRNTPVIVLTANAGSENRELYNRAGFDGYLVKPVSGDAMEETLIRHISSDKIILHNVMMGDDEDIKASDKYAEKAPVIITSSSMCDLPVSVIRKLNIPIIPFVIKTEESAFLDGIQIDANELIRHVSSGGEAVSSPPDESDYTEFFADALKKAHHVIHISITTGLSRDYEAASEAARSFENVSVVNSECISSAAGILVLIAYKLMQQGLQVKDILSELEFVKHRLRSSFVIDTTEYMEKKGLISKRFHRIAKAANLHPALRIKNDKATIGGLWVGRTKRAYRKYIGAAIPADVIPDSDVVFITYVGMPRDTLSWIEEEVKKAAFFEHVVFQQASAAISSNCGPGTFGILYFLKSNKSYNIASYLDEVTKKEETLKKDLKEEPEDMEETAEGSVEFETEPEDFSAEAAPAAAPVAPPEPKWYDDLDGIEAEAAIQNSGSEDAFRSVLKIFYDSIQEKHELLESAYDSEDWETYTIKIHALKSSARLVGALELGEKAERLEKAGKERDISYIREQHAPVMEEFLHYEEILAPLYTQTGSDKPVADEFLMEGIYEGLLEAAEAMDCDMVEEILKEIEGYTIPDSESEKFRLVCEKADNLDYDGMKEALKK